MHGCISILIHLLFSHDPFFSMMKRLKQGYAQLLDASLEYFETPGTHFVVTAMRDQPEWANWVQPIWLMKIGNTVLCSVSPAYATKLQHLLLGVVLDTLCSPDLLALMQRITEEPAEDTPRVLGLEWVQCELLYYPDTVPPALPSVHRVESLLPSDQQARRFLRDFDGGGYGIRAEDGTIAAHACIKNKGLLQEIAVGTESAYRQRGMGKAVVAAAVTQILQQSKLPVYWPDSLQNVASYQLAYALGFQKGAEMLFCCYALPNWSGFALTS